MHFKRLRTRQDLKIVELEQTGLDSKRTYTVYTLHIQGSIYCMYTSNPGYKYTKATLVLKRTFKNRFQTQRRILEREGKF